MLGPKGGMALNAREHAMQLPNAALADDIFDDAKADQMGRLDHAGRISGFAYEQDAAIILLMAGNLPQARALAISKAAIAPIGHDGFLGRAENPLSILLIHAALSSAAKRQMG